MNENQTASAEADAFAKLGLGGCIGILVLLSLVGFALSFYVANPSDSADAPTNLSYGTKLSVLPVGVTTHELTGVSRFRVSKGLSFLEFTRDGSSKSEILNCGCQRTCNVLPFHWRTTANTVVRTLTPDNPKTPSTVAYEFHNLTRNIHYYFDLTACKQWQGR